MAAVFDSSNLPWVFSCGDKVAAAAPCIVSEFKADRKEKIKASHIFLLVLEKE